MTPNEVNSTTKALWSGETPTTSELLELAMLDALGVLDDADADAYGRALANASSDVRAMVLDEQARLAVAEDWFADAEAPSDLRDRVMAAVHDAMSARAGDTPTTTEPVRHESGRKVPQMARARRVHPAWRAATMGLLVTVVSLAVVQLQFQGDFKTIREEASVQELFDKVGAPFLRDMLIDTSTQRIAFKVDPEAGNASATLWILPRWDEARLFADNLPSRQTGTFRVVQLNDAGEEVATLHEFTSTARLDDVSIPLAGTPSNMTLALFLDTDEGSTRLMVATIVRA